MKASIIGKLDILTDRHEEVSALLGDSETIADQNRFRDLSREYSELETVVQCYSRYRAVQSDLDAARAMLEDADPDLREMAKEEIETGQADSGAIERELQTLPLMRFTFGFLCNQFYVFGKFLLLIFR